MTDIRHVDYTEVRKHCGPCIHKARSAGQADLYELEWEGRPSILKDFSMRPWLVRTLVSRRICRREIRILDKLSELEEAPMLYAAAGPHAYIMQRLNAIRMPARKTGQPSIVFWDRARQAMQKMHELGIAHGDLRLKNILIGPENEAYLIDFATAIRRKPGEGSRISNLLFSCCRKIDRVKFARIKVYYDPNLPDEEEKAWLASEPWYLKLGRFMKRRFYRLTKLRKWKDKLRRVRRWFIHRYRGW
jgi:tRNA A-37 threonylcarbamoyl transferase component Bud32